MNVRPLSRDEVRSIDARAAEELGLPTLVLMENAGRGAAEWLRARVGAARPAVAIVCGPGNNGGDGGVVARHLDAWGSPVRIAWLARADQIRGDAAVQRSILERAGVDQQTWEDEDDAGRLAALLGGADWVVDALFGTGLTRPLEGRMRRAVEAINAAGKPVLALDLPSGLDADTGAPQGVAVRATATATFVAPKRGFLRPGAGAFIGEVVVVEIGVPRRLLEPFRGD